MRWIEKDYDRKVTLQKRIIGLLHKAAQMAYLSRTRIFLFLSPAPEDPCVPICFTSNRKGDARGHLAELAQYWDQLEPLTRVYTPGDLHTIRQGGISKTAADVRPGCGQPRGPKPKKRQQQATAPTDPISGSVVGSGTQHEAFAPPPERTPLEELLQPPPPGSTKSLAYCYANNSTAKELGAVCVETDNLFLYQHKSLPDSFFMNETAFRGARQSLREAHEPVLKTLRHPYDCYTAPSAVAALDYSRLLLENGEAAIAMCDPLQVQLNEREQLQAQLDAAALPLAVPEIKAEPEVAADVADIFAPMLVVSNAVRYYDYRPVARTLPEVRAQRVQLHLVLRATKQSFVLLTQSTRTAAIRPEWTPLDSRNRARGRHLAPGMRLRGTCASARQAATTRSLLPSRPSRSNSCSRACRAATNARRALPTSRFPEHLRSCRRARDASRRWRPIWSASAPR